MTGAADWFQWATTGGATLPEGKERFTQEQIAQALEAAHGLVAPAAKRLHCSEGTIRNYLKRYPELRAIAQEFRSALVDIAEGKLAAALHANDFRAVRLVLITLGKGRGYTVRMETTGPDGGAIPISGELTVGLKDDAKRSIDAYARPFAEFVRFALEQGGGALPPDSADESLDPARAAPEAGVVPAE